MKRTKRARSRLVAFAVALATAATFSAPGASPASATVTPPLITTVTTIVAGAGSVLSYVGYAQSAYGLFLQYAANQKPVSELDLIKAAILQSQTVILNQIDSLAAADGQGCAHTAVEQFSNVDTFTLDSLQTYVMNTVSCVENIGQVIDAITTDPTAVDKIGFALNTVGPLALFASAFANQQTGILTQDLIAANQHLMTRLQPTCGVTPDVNAALVIAATEGPIPGTGGQAPIPGHGSCYDYTHSAPAPVNGHIIVFPTGPGTGNDPWTITGDGEAEIFLGVFTSGYHVNWPPVADYSIAVDQAMSNTSYPVANAALSRLQAPVTGGSSIAAGVSATPFAPVEALRVNAGGSVSRNEVHMSTDTFSGWTAMDGQFQQLQSLTEASNSDGRLEMFGTDLIGRVYHRWQQVPDNDTSWSPWAQMSGPGMTSLAVARNQNGLLQLFGTSLSGAVFTRNQVLGADRHPSWQLPTPLPAVDYWTDWKQVGGGLLAVQVAAGINANGELELAGVNAAGGIFTSHQTAPNAMDPSVAGSWTGLNQLQGALTSIAMTTDLGGSLNLIGTNSSGAVYHSFQSGQNTEQWSALTLVPGPAMTNVAAAQESSGGGAGIDLFGVNAAGQISFNANDGIHGQPWSGWTPVAETPGGPPAVASPGNPSTVWGMSANLTLSAAGGTAPYTWTATGLPTGLTSSFGQISGATAAPGTYTVTATATDTVGVAGSTTFTWTVTALTVPDLVGSTQSSALGTLHNLGFGPGNVTSQFDCDNIGKVTAQSPGGGAQVAAGSSVSLTVGSSRDPNNRNRTCG